MQTHAPQVFECPDDVRATYAKHTFPFCVIRVIYPMTGLFEKRLFCIMHVSV
jgi:hypothetical protein